jgi:hypothetical protein
MKNKYQTQIVPMVDTPCQTDYGYMKTFCVDRTLYKDLYYLVCKMTGDETYTYFEMWDEEGFIGNYRVLNTNINKCIITKYVEDDFEISK